MTIDDMYMSIEEAKEEIGKRWDDKELEKKVVEYLNGCIPSVFEKEPKAVSASHVATPNKSFFRFLEDSKKVGLKPVAFEYTDDKFITTNFDKAHLAKMFFYCNKKNNENNFTRTYSVIDLSGKEEKKHIKEIKTIWGENFVDFHHRILNFFNKDVEIYDGSDWYHKMGESAKDNYRYVLALYIRNAILFENFSTTKSEDKFSQEILFPAFEYVYNNFGLKPLIVPLYSKNDPEYKYWSYYPELIKNLLNKA